MTPHVTQLGAMPEELVKALGEAKAADDVYGIHSEESWNAWNEAEAVSEGKSFTPSHPSYRYRTSAQSSHHHYSAVIDPQSLEAVGEAFGRIEYLARLVKLENNRIAREPNS